MHTKRENGQNKQFYVGVTYCGSSIQEAKELIDKVKDYTNLFVLQSGLLMSNAPAIYEIGDYACAANLSYAVYGSKDSTYSINNWLLEAKERWGTQFIGIYYNDEPGGNMIDNQTAVLVQTRDENNISTYIAKGSDGSIQFEKNNYTVSNVSINTKYFIDGRIIITNWYPYEDGEETQTVGDITIGVQKQKSDTIKYYPDGTITIEETTTEYEIHYKKDENNNRFIVSSGDCKITSNFYMSGNITKYPHQIPPYEEVAKQNPIQTVDDAAEIFVNGTKEFLKKINIEQLHEKSITVLTADYGLYWWDYKSGYDVILAELGWNHTIAQDIGLIRGAATAQGKSWGTIITWKYDQPPYLPNGEEMYEQLKTSYEAGAEYVIIFNYSENQENHNTLQEEHFQTLEQFWNNIVQNPKIKHGNIQAEAALILPQNYGWGMRHPKDNIWGIWPANETTQQIWNQLQNKLDKHGPKLDIIYEDPNYPVAGRYSNIYYWDQK